MYIYMYIYIFIYTLVFPQRKIGAGADDLSDTATTFKLPKV